MDEQQQAKPKKSKPRPPRVNVVVRKVIDADTGELLWALVPMHDVDRRALRERRVKPGDLLAAEFKPPRDVIQWRKAHALGQYCVQNIEGFERLTAHGAIKRLQEEGDIECDHEMFDLGQLGRVTRKVARSLSFESMTEDVFQVAYAALCQYLGETYLGGVTDPHAIEEMIRLMPPVQFN